MGGIRNPAHGGTFDLFYGNQVYEQGRSAEKLALKYIRQLKLMYILYLIYEPSENFIFPGLDK
jgi:hypothetical protein